MSKKVSKTHRKGVKLDSDVHSRLLLFGDILSEYRHNLFTISDTIRWMILKVQVESGEDEGTLSWMKNEISRRENAEDQAHEPLSDDDVEILNWKKAREKRKRNEREMKRSRK